MNSKKHRILTSLCLLTMLALLVGCTNNSSSTPETICGTYTSGEAEFQKILAVDQNNQVYYADQKNDCFILGVSAQFPCPQCARPRASIFRSRRSAH